jgi:integrase
MSVHTRKGAKGNTYRVQWRDTAGRQRSESFRLKGEATRFDAARKLDPDWLDADGASVPMARERQSGPTVADVWRRLADSRDVGASRAATDESLFRIQLAPLHNVGVATLDALAIRKWQKDLRAQLRPDGSRRYKDSTVGEALGTLRKILSAAIELKAIAYSPAATVSAPDVIRPPLTETDVLTPDEVTRVLAELPPRWRGMFGVMAYSGCRLSEILGLTPALVDAVDGFIHVGIQTTEDVGGKRRVKPAGKTRNADRAIPLVGDGPDLLREHLANYPVAPTTDPVAYGLDPYLIFRTETGAIPNRSNLRQRVWNPALKRAGVNRPIPMKNLRHTHASWVFAVMDPISAAVRLGHAKASTGQDTYARFMPKPAGHERALLDAFLSVNRDADAMR